VVFDLKRVQDRHAFTFPVFCSVTLLLMVAIIDQEIKRLKNLKKHDIIAKLKAISAITGNTAVGFNELDLEEDFDPGTKLPCV
jgi:hypothetical protein